MQLTTKIAALGLLTVVSAQGTSVYPPFVAEDVVGFLRQQWCVSQIAACPLLCADRRTDTVANECFTENLYYQCICSDGQSPDLKKYSQTVPYYQCTHVVSLCVDNCRGGAICADNCRKDLPCGSESPPPSNSTTASTTRTSSTSTPAPTGTGDFQDGFAQAGDGKGNNIKSPSAASSLGLSATFGGLVAGIAAGVMLVL